MAKNASKSSKRIKQMCFPPFWGDVGIKKWSPFFSLSNRSAKTKTKKRRPLFNANIPPKWIVRHPPHRHLPHQTSTTPWVKKDIHHIRHPPHQTSTAQTSTTQTSTTPDIHHTLAKKGIHHTRHPPHRPKSRTSTTQDISHTWHPPHQTSTTPWVN